MSEPRPAVPVAVVMEREAHPNRWEDWRHLVVEVVMDEGFGADARVLRDDGQLRRTLHPAFAVELFHDEGEGYYLNLTSGAPAWFVLWRIDDDDAGSARPVAVTVSYNEAGRWLDAQERVDNVPLGPELIAWLQAYTGEHYRPEPKQRRRPQSFVAPGDRR
jgi:hypothetical protein